MALYTQLSRKDLHAISAQYNLLITHIDVLFGGNANSSFVLQNDTNKYVLTFFEEHTFEYVSDIADLLLHLEKHNFPAPRLLKTNLGMVVTRFDQKPVIIKHFVQGSIQQELSTSQLFGLGQATAQLHLLPSISGLPNQHSLEMTSLSALKSLEVSPVFEESVLTRTNELYSSLPSQLPTGIIHGDLFSDNILFLTDSLASILDFERACFHPFIFDLGMALIGSCSIDSRLDFNRVHHFLSGYQDVRNLTNPEKQHLQSFAEYAALLTACWRYWQYHFHHPDPAKQESYLGMMHLAITTRNIDATRFLQLAFQ